MRSQELFTTIRTEGGLLPTDMLQRIANNDSVKGLDPSDYHLAAGERLNEGISRSWTRLTTAWKNFRIALEKLPSSDPATSVTKEKWLLILFQELGYGRLVSSKSIEIQGRSYSISQFWQNIPIHLIGFNVELDRRTANIAGAARTSPHSLVQDFLNRSEQSLWGFVSNGSKLRVLRDNKSLTRQAYIEFDLQGMMNGEVFADFALLWLICHQSRVEGDRPETCWLEKWMQAAQEQGTRALERLREGVEHAINSLGAGFLSHASNAPLREKLRAGILTTQDYYRQLLRLVYRLLFLFVAEDRELLLIPNSTPETRGIFHHYSTGRMRRLAQSRKGTRHSDIYCGFRVLMEKLSDTGYSELGLPALGSFLWSNAAIPDLGTCDISNLDFLNAIRALAFREDHRILRPVDYKNLGSEELGSVYESLLELHPEIDISGQSFQLKTAPGHERKTTGSYYTPTSLIQCLLDSALDPVLDDACKKPDPSTAILNLKICDPACGSGHFLVAAAHRIAKRLAAVRTGDQEPSPEALRRALRDVIGHCIYGVDINPMSVELCKVSLWMEALEPGKPLSFLEHRIQCGNSLIGATPELLKKGIPDEAFTPIEGDDKAFCTKLKKRNKQERAGNRRLEFEEPWERLGDLASSMIAIDSIGDESIEGIRTKQERYEKLIRSAGYEFGRLWADAWCAAFVWKKTTGLPFDAITEDVFRGIERNPYSISATMRDEIRLLADQYKFFHWHLNYPEIFNVSSDSTIPNAHTDLDNGFDVVIGNPPWVRQEQLKDVKKLLSVYRSFSSTADLSVLFIELSILNTRLDGFVALLTPNKWFKSNYAKNLREVVLDLCEVVLLVDFGHSRNLFPEADTFPAAIVLKRILTSVDGDRAFRFLKAHDEDREQHSLMELFEKDVVSIPHGQLLANGWQLEHPDVYRLLCRLLKAGESLKSFIGKGVYSGIKSGFNEAFYIDTELRNHFVESVPKTVSLLKPFLRGRDLSRWSSTWMNQWHIIIPSSQDVRWPWSNLSEDDAEITFEREYPLIYQHLKQFRSQLKNRTDKGRYWWELRPCDYYHIFDNTKILVQCIAFDSQFLLDTRGFYINNSSLVIPTDDLYLLAVLNSRLMWWLINRIFPHMKDEAISIEIQYLENLPIPHCPNEALSCIRHLTSDLMKAKEYQRGTEMLDLEIKLSNLVDDAFGLSKGERELVASTLPVRDPLNRQKERFCKII